MNPESKLKDECLFSSQFRPLTNLNFEKKTQLSEKTMRTAKISRTGYYSTLSCNIKSSELNKNEIFNGVSFSETLLEWTLDIHLASDLSLSKDVWHVPLEILRI